MVKLKILGMALLCSLLCFSCSKDEKTPPGDPIESGAMDVLGGYNCLIFSIDSISDITLHTQLPVELKFKEHPLVDFKVEKDGERQVIRTILKKKILKEHLPISVRLDIDILKKDSDNPETADEKGKYHKSCYVILRPSSVAGSEGNDISYAGGYIGKGTQLHRDFGNATYPVFDFNLLLDKMGNAETPQHESYYIESCGKRYNETLDAIAGGFNLGGLEPKCKKTGICFSGSTALNASGTTLNISEYEFVAAIYSVNMSEVKVDPAALLPTGENCTDIGYTAYLTASMNDMLNNPGSPAYSQYGNDSTGICALLATYGTHIITKATFGGSYTSLYGREASVYSSSVGTQFTASAQGKKSIETPEGMETWASIYTKKTGSPNITGGFNIDASGEDLDEASSAITRVTQRGGSPATNLDEWVETFKSSDKSNWVPVFYGSKDNGDPMLIPLSNPNICLDSARRAALETYIPVYLDMNAPEEKEMTSMKVVDFYMKTGENGRQSGDAVPFVRTDPWGVKRIYYPLMANTNAPSAEKCAGYALETSCDDYFLLADSKDHYWYYAMAHMSDHRSKGILDVVFSDKDLSGYTRRAEKIPDSDKLESADTGSGGDLKKVQVQLKLASDEPESEYIRAIGLTLTKSADGPTGRTIASTAGAEMKLPFSNDEARFNEFWDTKWGYVKSSNLKEKEEIYYSFYNGTATFHNKFKPFYITDDIFEIEDLLYGNTSSTPKFVHPRTWGENPY